MTKHLRLIMLSLLAMICLGGYSQESVTCTLATKANDCKPADVSWNYSKESTSLSQTKGVQFLTNTKSTIVTLTGTFQKKHEVTKVIVNAARSGSKGSKYIDVLVGDKRLGKQVVSAKTNKNYEFATSGNEGILTNSIKIELSTTVAEFSHYIKTVTIVYKGKNPTTVSFGKEVDNNTFKVKDGETFEGRVANCTTEGATGTIVYKSSDEAIALVDATTGAITLGAKYGTATITAQFVATGNYANSEARYSIKHLEDFVFYESFDKCNGEGGIDGIVDSWSGSLSGDALSDNESDKTDNPGWTFVNGKERTQCASFGASDKGGSATSPNIQIDQKALLKFKAACWNTIAENSQITISVSNGTLTYNGKNSQSVTIDMVKGAWTDYSMIVSGTNPFTVTFAGSDTKNRFFLDEVMVTKVAPQEITLDENSDNIVEAAENANVTLKRKLIADDNWNTLCVPFNLTPEQTTKAFGADVELRTLTHAEGTTLTFGKATEIEAGKPYLIRVKEVPADNVYKFTGVKVIASGDNRTIHEVGNVHFIGLYAPRDVTELEILIDGGVALFLGDNNKFFRAQSGTKMGGFRAFFLVSKDTNPTNVKAVIDGVANGIEDLVIDGVKANGRVYNLNGQYVGKSLNGLQPGLYIQNGKKIVIK